MNDRLERPSPTYELPHLVSKVNFIPNPEPAILLNSTKIYLTLQNKEPEMCASVRT